MDTKPLIRILTADTSLVIESSLVLGVVLLGKESFFLKQLLLLWSSLTNMSSLAIALRLRQTAPAGHMLPAMPTRIDLTDGLDTLVPMLQQNISLNFPPEKSSDISINSHQFSWGEPPNSTLPLEPDVVLAADCSYLEQSFRPLLITLTDLMGPETVLWFCYEKRRRRDRGCLKMLSKAFHVLPVSGDWERDDIWLFQVRRSTKKPRIGEATSRR